MSGDLGSEARLAIVRELGKKLLAAEAEETLLIGPHLMEVHVGISRLHVALDRRYERFRPRAAGDRLLQGIVSHRGDGLLEVSRERKLLGEFPL
jgi:hypothetical protein